MARTDYSRQVLPFGAGSTTGLTKRHYEAIADVLRNARYVVASQRLDGVQALDRVIGDLASRFAQGNPRFDRDTFRNAATDAARGEQ